jgi:hypothetical protein
METIILKKHSESERIPLNEKKTIILNSRTGVHYKCCISNLSNNDSRAYHISESTSIELEELQLPFVPFHIQFESFGQKCEIKYSFQ